MKRTIGVVSALLLGLVVAYLGYRWNANRLHAENGGVYREYDQEFRAHLAEVTRIVGKETIKVERLSEQFTVPQKLTIQGTPFEIGLTIGHFGKRTKAKLPLVEETN